MGKGPIYGVELLDTLPVGTGTMQQQLPSREDLVGMRRCKNGERVVSGYEVLLCHYRLEKAVANLLAVRLAAHTGTPLTEEYHAAYTQLTEG